MTNSSPTPDPPSSDKTPLGFDDFIGILVAFSAIGGIIWWSLSRNPEALNLNRILSPSDRTSIPLLIPSPQPTAESGAIPRLLPPVSPTVEPEEVPQRRSQVPIVVVPNTTVAASPTPRGGAISFIDVPPDYWARPYINALAASGVVSGYAGDYFRPNQTITRAEFAALVQDAFNNQSVPGTTEYIDVEPNFWGIPAINSATRTGFLQGYPGDIFRPTQEIPRVQVLVALASGLKLPVPTTEQVLQSYQDASEIPNYAREKVAAATNAGIVANYPDRNLLAPNRNATRAEVAAIVYQAMVHTGKLKPISSSYVGNAQ